MMGVVVTGRPVESAWLVHSEEGDDCGYSRAEEGVCDQARGTLGGGTNEICEGRGRRQIPSVTYSLKKKESDLRSADRKSRVLVVARLLSAVEGLRLMISRALIGGGTVFHCPFVASVLLLISIPEE
ncbi:hypothetical protein INR49_029112 [Caranx melampygus]|nr:hypothetical protein INR49_029112 [Caranx melampygus]